MKPPFIISASRRTDLPAFYSQWLKNRFNEGYAMVKHPFSKKEFKVSLLKKDVIAIVFWTKNFKPMLEFLKELQNKEYFCIVHYTITGLGKRFEPNAPQTDESLDTISKLSSILGKQKVFWRFDPIIFTSKIKQDETLKRFEFLSKNLKGVVERCYFSFLDVYERVETRIKKFEKETGEKIIIPSFEESFNLSQTILKIAHKYNISLHSCCEPQLIGFGIEKAHCIDAPFIQKLTEKSFEIKLSPTRKNCACYFSIDIGAYDTCPHLCWYCYANSHPKKVRKAFQSHSPKNEFLISN